MMEQENYLEEGNEGLGDAFGPGHYGLRFATVPPFGRELPLRIAIAQQSTTP